MDNNLIVLIVMIILMIGGGIMLNMQIKRDARKAQEEKKPETTQATASTKPAESLS